MECVKMLSRVLQPLQIVIRCKSRIEKLHASCFPAPGWPHSSRDKIPCIFPEFSLCYEFSLCFFSIN